MRLPKAEEDDEKVCTVVQPDLVVVCEQKKLDERGCKGAPDLIIEILSPQSAGKDMKIKFYLYEREGVREYWIVDPEHKTVQVFKLEAKGKYGRPEVYITGDQVKVGLFSDLVVDLGAVFDD